MSLDFQDLCDLTSEIENEEPGHFREWFYVVLVSAEVRASLFDETIPDRVSLARLSRRSPLAASVVAEFSGRTDRAKNLDAVNTVVKMLNSLNEIRL